MRRVLKTLTIYAVAIIGIFQASVIAQPVSPSVSPSPTVVPTATPTVSTEATPTHSPSPVATATPTASPSPALVQDDPEASPTSAIAEDIEASPSPTLTPIAEPTITSTVEATPTPTVPVEVDRTTQDNTSGATSASELVNEAPVVNAGSDQEIILPKTVTLSATVSDDGLPDGDLKTSWQMLSGPGIIQYVSFDPLNPEIRFEAPGTYTFRFTARDGEYTVSDDVIVTVLPQPEEDRIAQLEVASVDRSSIVCYNIPFLGSICFLNLSITGEGFNEGTTVNFRTNGTDSWIPLMNNGFVSETQLAPGIYAVRGNKIFDLQIVNSSQSSVTIPSAFSSIK
ncbi:MAG: PKD domain-containing protein [Patescibacteria group bacterium]